ncbi:TPA: hypothetical protein DEG21_04260 [Patescibacteria group bacterium]|nr:hypothetical protein [Candidatus Gracilibacteria bacterium]HBY75056.1 hypothetical protein [Candidatus Gracilibacteria bacterium]
MSIKIFFVSFWSNFSFFRLFFMALDIKIVKEVIKIAEILTAIRISINVNQAFFPIILPFFNPILEIF